MSTTTDYTTTLRYTILHHHRVCLLDSIEYMTRAHLVRVMGFNTMRLSLGAREQCRAASKPNGESFLILLRRERQTRGRRRISTTTLTHGPISCVWLSLIRRTDSVLQCTCRLVYLMAYYNVITFSFRFRHLDEKAFAISCDRLVGIRYHIQPLSSIFYSFNRLAANN